MAYDFIILYLCCVKIIKRVMKKLECIWNRIYDNSEVGLYSLTVSKLSFIFLYVRIVSSQAKNNLYISITKNLSNLL